ncbi:MAG: ATPase domain-containing protein, partial [Gemmatimonadaceae bacterium]
VIDSLTGFEVALAPAFREDFRESLYRLVGALTATQITVFMTLEAVPLSSDAGFTGERVSFITDDIIVMRFVELDGVLEKIVAVAKMRRSRHSQQFWRYAINAKGAAIGEPLVGYQDILTGQPKRSLPAPSKAHAGLTAPEAAVLDTLVRLGETRADLLSASAGVPGAEVDAILDRLAALGYAARTDGADATVSYRAIARGAGP